MVTKKKLELLAPAKNLACGLAAISHGADAIYIGGPKFGAREDACNSLSDIETLISEARIFGVKVYVTLNTILFDHELEEAEKLIKEIYQVGADALIIQDFGILELDLPPISLHASTQMHNFTLEQVKFLEAVHFKRAVLARELSLEQIRTISSQTKLELEAFVHGALCVSLSGRCYLSHAIGGRSANRGACAQPCRKKYTLTDSSGKVVVADQHLLSLKDLNRSNSIADLAEAGVQSFKLEGRLKDLDYVKNVTSYYRRRIDAFLEEKSGYEAASDGKVYYSFDADPSKTFNRGSTEYFLNGREEGITSFDSPKFLGEEIGMVNKVGRNFFEIATKVSLSNNDGLVFINPNGESVGIKVNVAEHHRIFPDKMNQIYVGAKIFRNYDHQFQERLKTDLTVRKMVVSISMREVEHGFELSLHPEKGLTITSLFDIPKNPARDIVRSKESIVQQLSKTGETSYIVSSVETNGCEKFFFQTSLLNSMRRELLDHLMEVKRKHFSNAVAPTPNDFPYPVKQVGYDANISNQLAVKFFKRHGVNNPEPAFERLKDHNGLRVMTTKHCLKYEMGWCPRYGGRKPEEFKEPYFLLDGKEQLRLDFDCLNCMMNIFYR